MAKKSGRKKTPGRQGKSQPDLLPQGYEEFVRQLKERIQAARVRAALAVNRELVVLYWEIGRDILARQAEHGWGSKVVDRLAVDLQKAFPGVEGFSPRNLKYMRAFAAAWPHEPIVQEALAQITWYHNLPLLEKVKEPEERLWYARAVVVNGWSRNVLVHWIESDLYQRQGKAPTNFERTIPPPQSDLAQQILKDPYNFDFLTLAQDAAEKEFEEGLLAHSSRSTSR